MSDSPSQKLSEIGHLFLSSVRNAAGNGQPRPQRTPPGTPRVVSVAAPVAEPLEQIESIDPATPSSRRVPMTIVLANHLGGSAADAVTRFAASRCENGQRVGLICLEAAELSLSVFDRENQTEIHGDGSAQDASGDPRAVTQALDELAWDVDHWLFYTSATREPRAQKLFAAADEWALLSTCDHDGVVSSYRTLKGLSELPPPNLSLVCVDAASEVEAQSAFERIDGVCQQFLDWSLASHSELERNSRLTGHLILRAKWSATAADSFWSSVSTFFVPAAVEVSPRKLPVMREIPKPATAQPVEKAIAMTNEFPAVIELSADDSAIAIVSATINAGVELTATPIKPPMLPEASLAIDADRRLMLFAVAKRGLSDLKLIGRAYQWLIENRGLVAMALPTHNVDAGALPHLNLLVDQTDLSADLLQPLMMTGNVTVQAYRKLRWGDRVGMLLEAA